MTRNKRTGSRVSQTLRVIRQKLQRGCVGCHLTVMEPEGFYLSAFLKLLSIPHKYRESKIPAQFISWTIITRGAPPAEHQLSQKKSFFLFVYGTTYLPRLILTVIHGGGGMVTGLVWDSRVWNQTQKTPQRKRTLNSFNLCKEAFL